MAKSGTNYAIDDEHCQQLTCGLQDYEARKVAQRLANERGVSVYLYEEGSTEEPEEFYPED